MKTPRVSWIISDQNVSVNYNGETHIVKRTDGLADRLIKALKENKLADIPNLVSVSKRIETASKGAFVVKDGLVMINGVEAPRVLSDKIIRFSNDGLPFKPLLKFAENLQKNPSFRAVNELYQFLEKNDHPITETGNFIAYKRVREDFTDIHSGTFDNSVGQEPWVNRNEVDEDSSRTCSKGLHVANWDYAHTQFASRNPATDVMLEVEVNPADVVAIPTDYNQSKMRVCRYKVLDVVTQPYDPSESLRVLNPDYNRFDDEEEEVEDHSDVCQECGCSLEGSEVDLCVDCDDQGEEEEDECERCGVEIDEFVTPMYIGGDLVCADCFYEEEDDDKYPYEDEFSR